MCSRAVCSPTVSLPPSMATYVRGIDIASADGTEVLATTVAGSFDRDWRHYTSHLQAPSSGRVHRMLSVEFA